MTKKNGQRKRKCNGKYNRRSFDYATHAKTVSLFAQDDSVYLFALRSLRRTGVVVHCIAGVLNSIERL